MRLLFARKNSLGSWLIRVACWSRWSHVAVVDGDRVIESTLRLGVHGRPLREFLFDYVHCEAAEVACPDDEAGLRWARAQIGLPYDKTGIFGLVMRRDWQEPDAWFCSELAEGAVAAAGRARFRADLSRITPQHSWMVSP